MEVGSVRSEGGLHESVRSEGGLRMWGGRVEEGSVKSEGD